VVDLLVAHAKALQEFDRRVRQIGADQWRAPTPCTEWTVHDVVNHLVTEQLWVTPLLEGQTMAQVGDRFDGDQLGADPKARWNASATEARAAWVEPGAVERQVHLSFGDAPATEYGWQMTLDLAVHAWDLAAAIGVDDTLDDALVQELYDVWGERILEFAGAGIFGRPVAVSADADTQTMLLAVSGRDRAAWR
jgi:uncharacterized protein (TIGR03086 family)